MKQKLASKALILFVFGLLVFSLAMGYAGSTTDNFLKNGSFEEGLKNKIPLNWGEEYYNCYIVKDVDTGKNVLKIINKTPLDSLGAQKFPLDGRKVRYITASCNVKAENIQKGKEDWQKGNLQVLFFDEKEKQLGGWPQLGPWAGSFGWKQVSWNFVVPKDTRECKVVLGLVGASGAIYFDDVVVKPTQKDEDPNNLISNGDFEIWEDWAYGGSSDGGKLVSPGYKGSSCLFITNPVPMWSFASQSIPVDGRKVKKIIIEGYVKSENVVNGPKPWQKARVNIEFKDRAGKRIDGWPIVDEFTGTFGWKKISNTFTVPEETRRVDFFAGLLECSGTAWFDELKMEGYDEKGNKIKKGGTFETDKTDWYVFKPSPDDYSKNITDVSFLLDPPAGKHGFLKAKEGHFYFADGVRARFWGTNIVGPDCFPDHKTAEKMANRLAKFGCNLVRFHHMDAFWADPNIFDPKYNDTQHLSAKNLEKLDYLVWQLKQKGIYVFMDLLVDREFKEEDKVADYKNVERGAKISGFYNKKIIDLQKKFAKDLLLHTNPYTNLKYADDPAVVSVKLINEAMLYYIGTQFGLSKIYMDELDSLWNKWLAEKYKSRKNLQKAWTDKYGRCDLEDNEDPTKNNVRRAEILLKYQRSGVEKVEPLRIADTMAFYYDLQVKYFKEMESYLKGIGVKVPISGSNHWVNVDADVKSNAQLDYIDRHRYWDHPQLGYGTQVVFENQPMTTYPVDALPNNFAFYKVADKPYAISEWNCCFPNEFRTEGPMIMAAYARLQDWDAVLQFSFSGGQWGSLMSDNFDIGSWPNVFTQWPAAALMFFRGDVKEAKTVVEEVLSDKDIFDQIYEDRPIADSPFIPLIVKTQKRYVKNFLERKIPNVDQIISKYVDEESKLIKSETHELFWDYGRGIFRVDTDRTQGAVGFIGNYVVKLKDAEVVSKTSFCSVFLSSISKEPISSASAILLTANARIENTGQKFNESKTQLKEIGIPPILIEGVDARIKLKRTILPSTISIYSLDVNGKRKKSISYTRLSDGIEFNINTSDKTPFYEIILK